MELRHGRILLNVIADIAIGLCQRRSGPQQVVPWQDIREDCVSGIVPLMAIAHKLPGAVGTGEVRRRKLDPQHIGKNSEKAMSLLARVVLAVLLATTGVPQAQARDEATPAPVQTLVVFNSDEGLARLARATAKVDFPALANQFEAQSNIALCGPTTTAIVLNAVRSGSRDLPRDRSRLNTDDLQYFPTGFDLTVPRFTQDNVIGKGAKTRAQVLGEPVTINGSRSGTAAISCVSWMNY